MGRESRRKREKRKQPTPGNPYPMLEMSGEVEVVEFFTDPDAIEFTPIAWANEMLRTITEEQRTVVPCGGCTECCRHALVEVHEHLDDASQYQTVVRPNRQRFLKQRADGSCVYLIDNVCSIYERRPFVCRAFDCRMYMLLGVVPRIQSHRAEGPREVQDYATDVS
jgi:putative zinc- or iron-chelating protein